MATNEPMTNERLSEITARMRNIREMQMVGPVDLSDLEPEQWHAIVMAYAKDVADLLAEVERLRAEVEEGNAALHEQIQAWMSQKAENERLRAREQALEAEAVEDESRWIVSNERLRDEEARLELFIEEQQAQIDAMRPVVEAVAEAGVGDEYGGGSWLMFAGYDAETVREQARAFVAAHPATATAAAAAGEVESEGE